MDESERGSGESGARLESALAMTKLIPKALISSAIVGSYIPLSVRQP